LHSHSYSGNPLGCRAALAVCDIFDHDGVLANNWVKSARLTDLAKPIATHARVRHFRNVGVIWALDIDSADPHIGRRFYQEALHRGLLLRPLGRTVYFMPPYVIEEEHMRLLVDGTLSALEAALAS